MLRAWRSPVTLTIMIAVLTALATLAAVTTARGQVQRQLEREATALAGRIERALDANLGTVAGVGVGLPDVLDGLDHDRFAASFDPLSAAGLLAQVGAVSLVQPVTPDDLEPFLDGLVPSVRDTLELRLADEPGEHLVVTHTWPFEPNRAVLGLDVRTVDVASPDALRAAEEQRTVMTAPYELVQGPPGSLATITYLPVSSGPAPLLLAVAVRPQDLVDRVLAPIPGVIFRLRYAGDDVEVARAGDPGATQRLSTEVPVELYGRSWWLRLEGDPRPAGSLARLGPWLLPVLVGAALLALTLVQRRGERRLAATNAELAEANRVKDELLAAVSHDVRAPLTVIGGLVATLERQPAGPLLLREALPRIGRQVERVSDLVDDLLVTATGRGSEHLERRPTDLVGLTRQLVDDLGVGTVNADHDRLEVLVEQRSIERILTNLLTNAERHGAPPVEVEIRRVADHAELTVRDHGSGIDPHHAEAIFDPFAQVGRRRAGGIGLGLTIALRLAQANGAKLRVEPGPDTGAAFKLEVPLVATDAQEGAGTGR